MFTSEDFGHLYKILELEMLDIDCGSPEVSNCALFCCVGRNGVNKPIKWLLPKEEYYLVENNFHEHAELNDYSYMITYDSFDPKLCACRNTRDYRPFCCRMFPFRPVLDPDNQKVVDLIKASNEYFSLCWPTTALETWRLKAIEAWNYVLSDRDNLEFFARMYIVLEKSENCSLSFSKALETDKEFKQKIESLPLLSDKAIWELSNRYFLYLLSMKYQEYSV